MSQRVIEAAAAVSLAGIDPVAFLTAAPFDALVMQEVAGRRLEMQRIHDENQATMTANAVGKLFGG